MQGLQGVQGHQGVQGLQGVQGFQGYQGVQGAQGVQGGPGIQGAQGVQGHQGRDGQFGGATFYYIFDNDTDNTVSSNGYVEFSNTNLSLVNTISIADNDRNNANIHPFLTTIDDSTSDIEGLVKITEEANNLNFVIFNVIVQVMFIIQGLQIMVLLVE